VNPDNNLRLYPISVRDLPDGHGSASEDNGGGADESMRLLIDFRPECRISRQFFKKSWRLQQIVRDGRHSRSSVHSAIYDQGIQDEGSMPSTPETSLDNLHNLFNNHL
jgi:hypothetical protein